MLYDRLVDQKILKHAKRAKKIYCGKRWGEARKQDIINRRLYREARRGKTVVRLKNGDPFVFGRGGEELQYLQERGIEVEVVPGLSSALSLPELAKIPLTRRDLSSSLTIVSGYGVGGREPRWRGLGGTVIVLMGVRNLDSVVQRLRAAGKDSATPCALISWGSMAGERRLVTSLGRVSENVKRFGLEPPAILVVGRVVRALLDFRGRRIAAFRSTYEVERTKRLIRRAGGIPNIFEICDIVPADRELKRAASKKWAALIFMSASGVRSAARFFDFKKFKLVAVGGTTQRELKRFGCKRILIPRTQNLDGVRELLRKGRWGRILAFRSPLAKEKLEGAVNLVAYRVKPKNLNRAVKGYLKTENDFTLLTSSGLLRFLLNVAGKLGLKREFVRRMNETFVISLGEGITKYALKNGVWVNHEPSEPTLDSLFRGGS